MIDPKMFSIDELIETFLNKDRNGLWRMKAEIIPDYTGTGKCVVRLALSAIRNPDSAGYLYLRHSKGPRQGHFWDIYGDDYMDPSLAFVALLSAPYPFV